MAIAAGAHTGGVKHPIQAAPCLSSSVYSMLKDVGELLPSLHLMGPTIKQCEVSSEFSKKERLGRSQQPCLPAVCITYECSSKNSRLLYLWTS